jgi:hypothetical protein
MAKEKSPGQKRQALELNMLLLRLEVTWRLGNTINQIAADPDKFGGATIEDVGQLFFQESRTEHLQHCARIAGAYGFSQLLSQARKRMRDGTLLTWPHFYVAAEGPGNPLPWLEKARENNWDFVTLLLTMQTARQKHQEAQRDGELQSADRDHP